MKKPLLFVAIFSFLYVWNNFPASSTDFTPSSASEEGQVGNQAVEFITRKLTNGITPFWLANSSERRFELASLLGRVIKAFPGQDILKQASAALVNQAQNELSFLNLAQKKVIEKNMINQFAVLASFPEKYSFLSNLQEPDPSGDLNINRQLGQKIVQLDTHLKEQEKRVNEFLNVLSTEESYRKYVNGHLLVNYYLSDN